MTRLAAVEAGARAHALAILGGLHATAAEPLPSGAATLLLLGPGPDFWPHLQRQPEWQDGRPDPIDRWSRRAIGNLACDLGAKALFPFGGPPHRPFYTWALRSGHCFASPVRLLVHAEQGLLVSFRGALALREMLPLPPLPAHPCESCASRPCLSACPPAALTAGGYEVAACHDFLTTDAGIGCMTQGCAVRRACPLSQAHARMPGHSAYHMRQFHP